MVTAIDQTKSNLSTSERAKSRPDDLSFLVCTRCAFKWRLKEYGKYRKTKTPSLQQEDKLEHERRHEWEENHKMWPSVVEKNHDERHNDKCFNGF